MSAVGFLARWWGVLRRRVARPPRPSWPLVVGLAVGAAAISWRGQIEARILRQGPAIYAVAQPFVAHPERVVKPGPLSAAPRRVARLADCAACHEPTGVPDVRCLACHDDIAVRQRRGIGHHGRDLTGACRDCHQEHRAEPLVAIDAVAFNHQRAAFALHGRHAAVECRRCHEETTATGVRWRYLGLAWTRCADCHADPHGTQASRDAQVPCERCHRESGWTGRDLVFDHARDTRFSLSGAHARLACIACHVPPAGGRLASAKLAGLATTCAACHADPHDGQFVGADCARCHRESGWTGRDLVFDHARDTRFSLSGAHARSACTACHVPPAGGRLASAKLAGLGTTCATCHADPHDGQFVGADCARCHRESGWTGRDLAFEHTRDTRFALSGAHARATCVACHTPLEGGKLASAKLVGQSAECVSCHADPHRGQLGRDTCARCHTTAAWTGRDLVFEHARDTTFALSGRHARLACTACHTPTVGGSLGSAKLAGVGTACATCHADPHGGQFAGADCAACHTSAGWTGAHLGFDHQRSRFPLDALHRDRACASCHAGGRYRSTPTDCEGCHAGARADLAGTALPGLAPSPHHGKVACIGCHLPDVARPRAADHAARCAGCHTAHYGALYYARSALVLDLAGRALAGLAELDSERARAARDAVASARRLSSHNHEGAERTLRRLLLELGR